MPILTVNTKTLAGAALEGVLVYVTLNPAAERPIFGGAAAVYPQKLSAKTDGSGMATFDIIPSADLDAETKYEAVINWPRGPTDRILFDMPDRDDTLANIAAPVVEGLTLRFGTSDDAVPTAAELSIVSTTGNAQIPSYAGSKHHLIARLASESDIRKVVYSDNSRADQLGALTEYPGTVDVGGETYNVWVSNQALTQAAAVTITAT